MRVAVIGANGMLGKDLVQELLDRNAEVIRLDLPEFDIASPESAANFACRTYGSLDWCVNCAAYTAVDRAEAEEKQATLVNGIGVGYLSKACMMANLRLLHISTDFVFDGDSDHPYREDSVPRPISAYGRSKLVGENALAGNPRAVIVRTSWLFGPFGNCFPRTIVDAFRAGKRLRVVADQSGNPTYTGDLSKTLVEVLERDPFPGVYHACGPETMTWHDFASLAIVTATGTQPTIEPIATSDWPTPAKRPGYSALSCQKLVDIDALRMRPVRESLQETWYRLTV